MNWEQKFEAINALGEAKLIMRKPGNWYVSQRTEIKGDGVLIGRYGNGATPQEAVEDHFTQLTDNQPVVVTNARGRDERKEYCWNGYMWKDVTAWNLPGEKA